MKIAVLLARILFSAFFIMSGFNHLINNSEMVTYVASSGVPLASALAPLSSIMALLGGLGILLGFRAKWGAWLIVLYLIPVTLIMHKFWGIADPQVAMMQMIIFNKNLSMLGGALLIAFFGSGPWSVKQ